MSLAQEKNREIYGGKGNGGEYVIPFRFDDPSWLKVTRINEDGTTTPITISQYSLTGSGPLGTAKLITSVAPTLATKLIIARRSPAVQNLSLTSNAPLPAKDLEKTLDHLAMAIIDRDPSDGNSTSTALSFPLGEPIGNATRLPMPALRKGMFIGFHDTTGEMQARPLSVALHAVITHALDTIESARAATATLLSNAQSTATTLLAQIPFFYKKGVNGGIKLGQVDGEPVGANGINLQSQRSYPSQVASGPYSIVIGNSEAFGENSISIGNGSISGDYTTSVGTANQAGPQRNSAFGYRNQISGTVSVAIGYENAAIAYSTNSIGVSNYAAGHGASAIGYRNFSSAYLSGAFGTDNQANGECSSAFGYSNFANGQYSVALGYQSEASAGLSVAVGSRSLAANAWAAAFGYFSRAQGESSVAIGFSNLAASYGDCAIGRNSNATGGHSLAIGNTTYTSGPGAFAMGHYCSATQGNAIAIGHNSHANGGESAAIGFSNYALAYHSAAFGYGTTVGTFGVTEMANIGNGMPARVRADGSAGIVALSFGYNRPAPAAAFVTLGHEPPDTLAANMLSFRSEGNYLHIDVCVLGEVRTISLPLP